MKLPPCPRQWRNDGPVCGGKLLAAYAERADGVQNRQRVDVTCLACGRRYGTFERVVTVAWVLVDEPQQQQRSA